MRKLTLIFGGKEYQIDEPTFGQAKLWRAKLEAQLKDLLSFSDQELAEVMREAAAVQIPTKPEEAAQAFEGAATLITKLSPALGQIARLALGSVDLAADLLFCYGPELTKRREELENVAYNDEIMIALWEVVKSAYPFLSGRVKSLAADLLSGQLQTRTITNLPDPNGARAQAQEAKS
jgi:hypothetical protein